MDPAYKKEGEYTFYCGACDADMPDADASEEIKNIYKITENGSKAFSLMCEECAWNEYMYS